MAIVLIFEMDLQTEMQHNIFMFEINVFFIAWYFSTVTFYVNNLANELSNTCINIKQKYYYTHEKNLFSIKLKSPCSRCGGELLLKRSIKAALASKKFSLA